MTEERSAERAEKTIDQRLAEELDQSERAVSRAADLTEELLRRDIEREDGGVFEL